MPQYLFSPRNKFIYCNHKVVNISIPEDLRHERRYYEWLLTYHARTVILKRGIQPAGISVK